MKQTLVHRGGGWDGDCSKPLLIFFFFFVPPRGLSQKNTSRLRIHASTSRDAASPPCSFHEDAWLHCSAPVIPFLLIWTSLWICETHRGWPVYWNTGGWRACLARDSFNWANLVICSSWHSEIKLCRRDERHMSVMRMSLNRTERLFLHLPACH